MRPLGKNQKEFLARVCESKDGFRLRGHQQIKMAMSLFNRGLVQGNTSAFVIIHTDAGMQLYLKRKGAQ